MSKSVAGGDFLAARGLKRVAKSIARAGLTPAQRFLSGPVLRRLRRRRAGRKLEIGPGAQRIAGFETLNITGGRQVDYVADATHKLPFPDNTFEVVYASHILEHVAWFQAQETLNEWARVLRPGGALEVWVPDGLKISEAFVAAEKDGADEFHQDAWWLFNSDKDPCDWMSGRLFSYGDGTGARGHFNWHLATYSPRKLVGLFEAAGLEGVDQMDSSKVRGFDHGWINLGVEGVKPA